MPYIVQIIQMIQILQKKDIRLFVILILKD